MTDETPPPPPDVVRPSPSEPEPVASEPDNVTDSTPAVIESGGPVVTETLEEAVPADSVEPPTPDNEDTGRPSFAPNPSVEFDTPPPNDPLSIDTAKANAVSEDTSFPSATTKKSLAPQSPLSFKRPASPQPWELVDPPPDNNQPRTKEYFPSTKDRSHALIPKSSYYFGPPPPGSAFGTNPIGRIGIHHPREIIRVERDYSGGELIQFAAIYPLELEGRITPTQFLETVNAINEILISAHSSRHALLDNTVQIFSLQLSRLFWTSHYEKEMRHLQDLFDELNTGLYNPAGLNLLWPRKVAFLFMEIEYY